MDYDKIFYTDGYASIFLITIQNEVCAAVLFKIVINEDKKKNISAYWICLTKFSTRGASSDIHK